MALTSGDPFATPAELADYTRGQVPATDPRAQALLDGASTGIRRYAGWHIWPVQPETWALDSNGAEVLLIPTLRLTGLTSVTLPDGALAADQFEWSTRGMLRRRNGYYFPDAYQSVIVVGTHGFDSVPDLKQVVLQTVSMALSSPTGATREQAGMVAQSWATTAPGVSGGLSFLARDLAIVDSYRLPRI